jgi:mono/diheme cytochrome c family protein
MGSHLSLGRGAGFALLAALALPAPGAETPAERGRYVYLAAGCENCHTDRDNRGPPLAGGRKLVTDFGTFYGPNITPDETHGIGRWSEADFIRAMRRGVGPKGQHYYPVFPYAAYTLLDDEDLRALWAYLRTVPAVAQANAPHELPWYLRWRRTVSVWSWLYFRPGPFRPDPARAEAWNRGAYLALAAGHCGECHTPRDRLGGLREDLHFAGNRSGPDGAVVPNITPHRATGIGRWRERDIVYYLETGMTPDGDFAGDAMAEIIDHGLRHLTLQDRAAVAAYLLTLPAIDHAVREAKPRRRGEF